MFPSAVGGPEAGWAGRSQARETFYAILAVRAAQVRRLVELQRAKKDWELASCKGTSKHTHASAFRRRSERIHRKTSVQR